MTTQAATMPPDHTDRPAAGADQVVDRAVRAAFATLALFGFGSAVFMNIWWSTRSAAVAAACTAVLAAGISLPMLQRAIVRGAARVSLAAAGSASVRGAAVIVGVGGLLRASWVWSVPPVQLSDMAAYFELAQSLSRGDEYVIGSDHAFWPPGLPLSLTPTLWLLGGHQWVPALNNILLFAITAAAVFALAARASDRRWALMAVCLIAVWPNWILLSGLASKELLVAALLSSAVWVHVGAPTWKTALAVGALCGAIALTQPSALMLPVVFVVGDAIRGLDYRLLTRRALVLPIGMLIVVGPWTVRNYLVLHQFVPVSSNGGVTLWVANHPGAMGQHVRVPDRLADLPELERDRVARREALQWMRDHPARVVTLAVRKQALFWADDAKGAYESMRRPARYGERPYAIAKGISNIFWIGLLTALVAGTLRLRRPDPAASLLLTTILCLLVYFESFQLVFEGDGRFHTPLMPLLAVAVVCTLSNASSRDKRAPRAVEGAGS